MHHSHSKGHGKEGGKSGHHGGGDATMPPSLLSSSNSMSHGATSGIGAEKEENRMMDSGSGETPINKTGGRHHHHHSHRRSGNDRQGHNISEQAIASPLNSANTNGGNIRSPIGASNPKESNAGNVGQLVRGGPGWNGSEVKVRLPEREVSSVLSAPAAATTFSGIYDGQLVEVPLINKTIRRHRIIEVPEIHVQRKYAPKIQIQEVIRKAPKVEVQWIEKVVEVPQIKVIEKVVEVPEIREVIRPVPRVEVQEIVHKIPKYEVREIEKFVEVPQVQMVEKFVEVPQVKTVVKYVEKVQVVDLPTERIKTVPKVEIREVEKIRYVPGPIEYIDIPEEYIVEQPITEVLEKIIEVPEYQDVIVERPMLVPSPGPEVEVPIEVPVYYDQPEYYEVPGKIIPVERKRFVEKLVEVPVYVPHDTVKLVKVPRPVPVDIFKEVPVMQYVNEVVEVPVEVMYPAPPPIIRPMISNTIIDEGPVYEQGLPRFVEQQPIWMPATYEKKDPIHVDSPAEFQQLVAEQNKQQQYNHQALLSAAAMRQPISSSTSEQISPLASSWSPTLPVSGNQINNGSYASHFSPPHRQVIGGTAIPQTPRPLATAGLLLHPQPLQSPYPPFNYPISKPSSPLPPQAAAQVLGRPI